MSADEIFRGPTAIYHNTTYPAIDPSRPELSTSGKTALVTGAGQGIGAAIARSLAVSGVSALALIGRTEKTLLQAKERIEQIAPKTRVYTYAADLVQAEDISKAIEAFVADAGSKIDILVANAGYMAETASIADSNPADWWLGYEINLKGNYNLLRAFLPHAAQGGGSVVVHMATSVMHAGYLPGFSSYRGSKIGAYKVFEIFGHEMRELGNGVRTVQVHPGFIRTNMTSRWEGNTDLPFDDEQLSGDFVNWCVSDEARFLDGKFIWANWDVEELKQEKDKIMSDKTLYTMNLVGWV
ncbi:hypothetical protein BX600DRAFT_441046 [Xylariales sp. PMI_506]|nr:hypothetical protein BX600DRAFT_441046 [Xylariales sp. PMI_506]